MKKIPRRVIPMLLSVLFTAGLLMAPASAEQAYENQTGLVDVGASSLTVEDPEIPSYLLDLIENTEMVAAGGLTCSHSKSYPTQVLYGSSSSSTHIKVKIYQEYCSTCDTSAIIDTKEEEAAHLFYPGNKYISSNHNGPYYTHTHTFGLECVCGYLQTEVVSAGCGPGNCVGPYSVETEYTA